MKNIYFIIYIYFSSLEKKKSMSPKPTESGVVCVCRDPRGKKSIPDHVTMDGVRCKLLAVWKTCVQTDWQADGLWRRYSGVRVEGRAVREERWWVTGPAATLFFFKPSPPLTCFPRQPSHPSWRPRPLFLTSTGPFWEEIHGSCFRNTLRSIKKLWKVALKCFYFAHLCRTVIVFSLDSNGHPEPQQENMSKLGLTGSINHLKQQ